MFKKTKLRLVILNALVFFILQNAFGAMIYFYMHYSLYHQVDQTIVEKKSHLLREREILSKELNPEREENHRLVYLLWDKKNQLNQIIPQQSLSKADAESFSSFVNKEGIQTLSLDGNSYKYLNMSVDRNNVKKIQIIYNLKREKEMLSHLLMVISFGSLLSVFIALLGGTYLANKALIPIRNSWDKQQQFVADASHELRTPLSVMKLNLEHLFRHPERSIEQESETIHQAIQELNYLTKMSSDLLTLARSDSDQLQVIQEPIQLDEILHHVVRDFKALAHLKHIQLTADIQPIRIIGDKERVKQLFVILLDNALKYTKAYGEISISGESKGSRTIVKIVDTGIGISKHDLPYIFDRYYRGNKSRTRHIEGSGLGLSIAKWIAQSHSGEIRVTSKEGEGTQVMVQFLIKKSDFKPHYA
ncbi:HAMP domain-containing sensor histidine kinase [Paenibacillus sp. BSR1-1]|uniref:sensor histidine kinase n=1 Tax=Paenibacillus sp. BSR1-1 TaxID=3020845 RepID=UPI0025AECF54|nr:HAMP domain-containing sensor histidine kinase [Paenibacillus sp. BSR1-1]MDN3017337.1 HAMP domain-containing sensor histidine kinase [Paenibacillus sp. BSR1-1]